MHAFLEKLVKACPVLPYLSFGIWLAWAYIAYSGTAWLSDTETDGANISVMYIMSTLVFSAAFLLATFVAPRVRAWLERPAFVIFGGAVASFGCLVVIAIGPYYLSAVLPDNIIQTLFYTADALSGLGTAIVGFKCAQLFGSLTPRKAILYAALSYIVLSLVYFTVIGAPDWQPVSGGPSLAGIIAFVGMPLLASAVATLSFADADLARTGKRECEESRALFPRSFWKLVAVTLVFSFVVASLRSMLIASSPVDVTLDGTRISMLLRMLMAILFACAAIGLDGERFNLGKIYSFVMAAAVALIALCPLVGVTNLGWSQVVTFLSMVFEFVLWCILSFVVYQRRISAVLVFGFGYGSFMLGSGAGWVAGVTAFQDIVREADPIALYLALAFLVLASAFVLFSEKEFENLFKTENARQATLDDLLGDELPLPAAMPSAKKGRFSQAVDGLASAHGLSKRETDVLKCLAMGYDAQATAEKLQVSWNTVRTHTRNVYTKLDVHSRQDIIELVDEATKRL